MEHARAVHLRPGARLEHSRRRGEQPGSSTRPRPRAGGRGGRRTDERKAAAAAASSVTMHSVWPLPCLWMCATAASREGTISTAACGGGGGGGGGAVWGWRLVVAAAGCGLPAGGATDLEVPRISRLQVAVLPVQRLRRRQAQRRGGGGPAVEGDACGPQTGHQRGGGCGGGGVGGARSPRAAAQMEGLARRAGGVWAALLARRGGAGPGAHRLRRAASGGAAASPWRCRRPGSPPCCPSPRR